MYFVLPTEITILGIDQDGFGKYSNEVYVQEVCEMDKKKRENMKKSLTTTQEVMYQREFKRADRAGGFNGPKGIRP